MTYFAIEMQTFKQNLKIQLRHKRLESMTCLLMRLDLNLVLIPTN